MKAYFKSTWKWVGATLVTMALALGICVHLPVGTEGPPWSQAPKVSGKEIVGVGGKRA